MEATSIISHLCGLGFDAEGYDPHFPFGYGEMPHQTYDLVLLIFVLNVLPNASERHTALVRAASYLSPAGKLLIVARAAREIDREARAGGWALHGDGYLSNSSRGMFQHGVSTEELLVLVKAAGLKAVKDVKLELGPSVYLVAEIVEQPLPLR
jgi:hypothetical protein